MAVVCSECLKEIDESKIVIEDGRIISYPAYCYKCELNGGKYG